MLVTVSWLQRFASNSSQIITIISIQTRCSLQNIETVQEQTRNTLISYLRALWNYVIQNVKTHVVSLHEFFQFFRWQEVSKMVLAATHLSQLFRPVCNSFHECTLHQLRQLINVDILLHCQMYKLYKPVPDCKTILDFAAARGDKEETIRTLRRPTICIQFQSTHHCQHPAFYRPLAEVTRIPLRVAQFPPSGGYIYVLN